MIPGFVSRLYWKRVLRRNCADFQDLETFATLDPVRQRADLARRLMRQVQHFGLRNDALPEWRDAASIQDPDELWKIWPSLPIVTKSMLNDRFPAADLAAQSGLTGVVKGTGGSTGEPTRFFHDERTVKAHNATATYTWLQLGWTPGTPVIRLWGAERDIGKTSARSADRHARLSGIHGVDGYQLTRAHVDHVLEIIRSNRRCVIYGFTSMLEYLANQALSMGAAPPKGKVVAAWNGGEMLFDHQVERFREAFGVPILNVYGGRELSVMAFQPAEREALRVMRPWLFLEVVDDRGRPVRPGEPGRLLWTSTVCRGTPFLRYEIGDMGAFAAEHETEAGITALAELHGRTAGLLKTPDGAVISCLYWNHLFKEVREVRQFQIVVDDGGGLTLRLKGAGFSPDREAQFRATLRGFLGDRPVKLEWLDRLPLTAGGKLMQVVSQTAR